MCGARLSELGVSGVLIIDSGGAVTERQPDRPSDLVCGQGGAGLYSDGKFSFAPAGTMAYQLSATISTRQGDRTVTSADAYEAVQRLFTSYPGREAPCTCTPQATATDEDKETKDSGGGFLLKPYPAVYLTLAERIDMIERLSNRPGIEFRPRTQLTSWNGVASDDKDPFFEVTVRSSNKESALTICCKWLVLGGGRFGPLSIASKESTARRIEFGVRIELPVEQGLFAGRADHLIDPKFIYTDEEGVEYRTFCVCRGGQSIVARFGHEDCVSGSGEGPASGFHNIGFNVRLRANHSMFERVRTGLGFFQGQQQEAFLRVSRENLVAEGVAHYGKDGLDILLRGFDKLSKDFPEFLQDSIRFSGPTIEGVGLYPRIDLSTLAHQPRVFVIGDASGIFRGTVPALLSGAFVAEQIAAQS